MIDRQALLRAATVARQQAYAPYSGFGVGAALQGGDGIIYTGCNVENASYGLTCCAERAALFAAVANGVHTFDAIAIVGGEVGEEATVSCPPCGACRQVLAEFCKDDFPVILTGGDTTLGELLPQAFRLKPR